MTSSEPLVFPLSSDQLPDAEPISAVLREQNPVPKVQMVSGGEVYLATRHEDVKKVFGDRAFSRAETLKPGYPALFPGRGMPYLLTLDPPDHTRVRKLMSYAFTARGIDRLRGTIEEIADGLIDNMISQGPPLDFITSFAMPLPARVMSVVLGVPDRDHDTMWGWIDTMFSLSGYTPEELKASGDALFGYVAKLIADKRAHPADDLMTKLIEATEAGEHLSEQELLLNTFLLIAAGYETTGLVLTNSILTLNRHPDQFALLREQPELIPGAVEELLRYVRISHGMAERVAMEDMELSGVHVPKGSVVIPLHYSANRDPACAEDPDRFDVTRPATPHFAFGYGLHFCLGAPLARLELQIAFGRLVERLPNLRPAIADTEVQWKHGLLSRAPEALPVTW